MLCQCESLLHAHGESSCESHAKDSYTVEGFGMKETFRLCEQCATEYARVNGIKVGEVTR
jgi:hypothetical protein